VNGIQVAHSSVLEDVLKRVQGSGNGKLPTIASKDGIVDLFEEDGGGSARS
jgi:hypothetical protein